MKPEELAAYIGAAAWLPQIATWLYRSLVKPKLRIVPGDFADVGFTSFGPIFNVRMAFFVENRDLIVDGIDLIIRHQDGESRSFRWAGLAETFSEITDASGNKQIISRDQTPIAIKITTQILFEKLVRFQEPRFHEADRALGQALVAHFNFLKQKNPNTFVPDVLESKELYAVVEGKQKWFCWKPGRYEVELKIKSPQSFRFTDSRFAFELPAVDVDHLKKNLGLIDTEIRNVISSNMPGFKPQPVSYQWVNVGILRSRDA
jgi:hypothetical protein